LLEALVFAGAPEEIRTPDPRVIPICSLDKNMTIWRKIIL